MSSESKSRKGSRGRELSGPFGIQDGFGLGQQYDKRRHSSYNEYPINDINVNDSTLKYRASRAVEDVLNAVDLATENPSPQEHDEQRSVLADSHSGSATGTGSEVGSRKKRTSGKSAGTD